ncbi:MAG: glycosyltransferase [Bacilli bacterium]|jgi:glycosyltransferase involved in cell wall biosynthesis|nr:glycosyltransferase [Bacilli bacterium]
MFEFLEKSVPITSQQWSEDTVPLVSIDCITYNHENFIRDAIEGFLMQKTTFPVEILIHDDASTDKTASIVREYEEKYPHLIKPIYQTENQYSKKDGTIGRIQRGRACGKYYAICEGDDYWTDPLKLQKQVDFLEENEEYSMCFHNAMVVYVNKSKKSRPFSKYEKCTYTLKDIIETSWFIPSQSIVFRKTMYSTPVWSKHIYNGDLTLQLLLAQKGPFYCIDEIMSVYRKHASGVSSINSYYYSTLKIIEILYYFNLHSNFEYHTIIQKRIQFLSNSLYAKFLYNRPFYVKILSIDFYIFKTWSFLSKRKKFKIL